MSPPTVIHDTTIVTADDAGTIHRDAALVVDAGGVAAALRRTPRAASPAWTHTLAVRTPPVTEHRGRAR